MSQHLRVLNYLSLVRAERRGYRIHYFLHPERLAVYRDLIREQLGSAFIVREREGTQAGGEHDALP